MKELKEWYKKVDAMYINKPLNPDEFELFMGLLCGGVDEDKAQNIPMVYLLNKRAKAIDLNIDMKTQIMVSSLCRTPAHAVIYVSYLKCKADEKNLKEITFNKFVDIFPNGYFNKKQLNEAWELQKIGGENLLDHIKVMT